MPAPQIRKHGITGKVLAFPTADEAAASAAAGKVSSRFHGVNWHKGKSKWQVLCRNGEVQKYLGRFVDELEAARVYDAYVSSILMLPSRPQPARDVP